MSNAVAPALEKKHHVTPSMPPVGSGTAAFVDKIDPFKKSSMNRKQKKLQGSSRYHTDAESELEPLPLIKGNNFKNIFIEHYDLRIHICYALIVDTYLQIYLQPNNKKCLLKSCVNHKSYLIFWMPLLT